MKKLSVSFFALLFIFIAAAFVLSAFVLAGHFNDPSPYRVTVCDGKSHRYEECKSVLLGLGKNPDCLKFVGLYSDGECAYASACQRLDNCLFSCECENGVMYSETRSCDNGNSCTKGTCSNVLTKDGRKAYKCTQTSKRDGTACGNAPGYPT